MLGLCSAFVRHVFGLDSSSWNLSVPSGAPRKVKATALNSSSIQVQWSPPSVMNLAGLIRGYMVTYQKVDDQGLLIPSAPPQFAHSDSPSDRVSGDVLVLRRNHGNYGSLYDVFRSSFFLSMKL